MLTRQLQLARFFLLLISLALIAIFPNAATGAKPPNIRPTVSITAPANGATFTTPVNITIIAVASDPDGSVTKVEFFNGATLLGTDTTAPYSFLWNNVPAGSHTLTAKATDNKKAKTTSAAVNITVKLPNVPPTVSITSPTDGASFPAPANITISANAADSDGTISKVEFFNGATLLNTDTSAPYSYDWTNVPAGNYTLTAKATDNESATTTSSAVTITVVNSNQPPAVNLTSPPDGGSFTAPVDLAINASASDSDGTVTQVQFFEGSTLLATDTTSPYSFVWTDLGVGNYTLTAKATDDDGAMTSSTPVAITVIEVTPVTLTFRQGVDGYSGTTDLIITDQYGGNGRADRNEIELSCYNLTGTGGYSAEPIIRFEQLSLPQGATVRSVSLTLTFDNWITNFVVRGYYLQNYWNLNDNQLGWLERDTGLLWNSPGARGIGTDVLATPTFSFTQFAGSGNETLTVDLDPGIVQSWITNPAGNLGMLLVNENDNAVTHIYASELGEPSVRPLLTIIYTVGSGNQPPIVSITSPANGTNYDEPANITIDASATDNDGSIAKVDFFDGSELLGTDDTAPYSFPWNNVPAGNYSLTAKAVDNTGTYSRSTPVNVTVIGPNTPPSVTVTGPANGATFIAPAFITINATATDSDGTISKVDFFEGSNLLNTDTVAPYSYTWPDVPQGAYLLTARATDNSGAATTSAPVSVTVNASSGGGQRLILSGDYVLTGSQSLNLSGTPYDRCTLEGNGYSIVTSGTWTGSVDIVNCDLSDLGTSSIPGIDLVASSNASVQISGNVFDFSGAVRVQANDNSTLSFRNNTILESALVPVTEPRFPESASAPVFITLGNSPNLKLFQGNHFYKSWAQFSNTSNWMIGGDTDADSNIMIAPRAGLEILNSTNFTIRGNYMHAVVPSPLWSQMTTVDIYQGSNILIEHNVLRGAAWIVRGANGEVRFNLLADFNGHNWIQGPQPGARIHHNVMVFNNENHDIQEGIYLYSNLGDVEIYNNTLDGGGPSHEFTQGAVAVADGGFLTSFRNNAVTSFVFSGGALRPNYFEPTDPPPARIGYTDYNLFYNPEASVIDNYTLSVAGKTERVDAGYAKYDRPVGGAVDSQLDPQFSTPLTSFPFNENDIKARTVTVSSILSFYRAAYTPLPSSPLIDAGDPADGAGVDIGAINAGASHPVDGFGRFGIPDSEPPTVAMTSPANGATVSGVITLSADASDNIGVSGVQFLLDSGNIGIEDTTPPYSIVFDTASVSNGAHNLSARARDAAGNLTTSAPVNVTISNSVPPPITSHPRIFLDSPALSKLQQKAQSGSTQWTTLRNTCDSYLSGTVEYPDGNDYPPPGSIGEGYQGSDYVPPLFNVGMCYQIGRLINDVNTNAWGAKGADILEKMSNADHSPSYLRDSGYGIRFFGVGMGIGYDWLYDALTPDLRTQVYTALNNWVDAFDSGGFLRNEPYCSNYFAGYYDAKAMAAIATDGENPNATAMWNDWYNRLHFGTNMVQEYSQNWLGGGGWSEGWNYGPNGTTNMSYPSLAAKTGKGLNLITDPARPYRFPMDQGLNLIHFTWPNRLTLDDRGQIYRSDNPTSTNPWLYTVQAGLMNLFGDSNAPLVHSFARTIRNLQGIDSVAPWQEMLFWDDDAPETSFTNLPLSYFASGMKSVAVRSSWNTGAIWASFYSGPYTGSPASGEEFYDQGGLAIVRGGTPFLVNATGYLKRHPTTEYDNEIYEENYGSGLPRSLYNVFYNGTSGQAANHPLQAIPSPLTTVSRFEDRNGYVYFRGSDLQDMYFSSSNIFSWTRDVIYFRPYHFVVYDRTIVGNTSGDQRLHFHFPKTPVEVTPPAPSTHRYDIADGSTFVGSVTTLLPTNNLTSITNVFTSDWVYRLTVRPQTPDTDTKWLTVFDADASVANVYTATTISDANGNSSPNVLGALLRSANGNFVAIFGSGSAENTITGVVTLMIPGEQTKLVVTDLSPNANYSTVANFNGSGFTVTIQPGTGFTTSASGDLYVDINVSGQVTPGN